MQLPIYRIVIDMDNPVLGMSAISLVEHPAIEVPFLCFDSEKQLFTADVERQIITGPAILADTPIYRCSPSRGEYQIVFEKDTIRQLVEKYSKNGLLNSVNLQHDSKSFIDSAVMVESMIIDKERGLCPNEFKDIPDGSWIVSYKITDDTLWNEIKNGRHLNGFSIEIMSELELVEKYNTNKTQEQMKNIFKLAKMLMKFAEVKTDKETLVINGELEVGKTVLVETENGPETPADGEYVAEDGTVIIVAEGVIVELKPIETDETPEQTETEDETPIEEDDKTGEVDELKAEIERLNGVIEEKDAKIAELEAKIAEQEEKLKLSVETPITKKKTNETIKEKATRYFSQN